MDCATCGSPVQAGATSCEQCNAPLTRICRQCGHSLPAGFRFCGACGQPLEDEPATWSGVGDPSRAGERRQLSVMFCDLVGSTPLSQRLDPEELRDLTRAFQALCSRAVEPFGGWIAQLLGDGILVYFGYPMAHEDDAIRAVNAGLRILEGFPELNQTFERSLARIGEREPVRVRIGVHTGPVLVDDVGTEQQPVRLALGDTVNIAARLLQAADPDTLVISDLSRTLVENAFALESLGPQHLKGIEEPVEIHRVLEARSPAEQADSVEAVPLVGRDRELASLVERLDAVESDGLQTALLEGEAGIGKSRLIRSLRGTLTQKPHTWLLCRCSAYHENSALYPVAGMLERALDLPAQGSDEERFKCIANSVQAMGMAEDAALSFADLLSVPIPQQHSDRVLSAEERRRRMLESIVDWLQHLAERSRVVLAIEDLHWIDPSTLDLLSLIRKRASSSPLLLLCTFRPTFSPPWAVSSPGVLHLPLGPLAAEETQAMARALVGDRALPAHVYDELVARTDGIPLFVEELTRAVLETQLRDSRALDGRAGAAGELAIPATLQDSLMARLDRLGTTKSLAQLAAVFGREFPADLLGTAAACDRETLELRLTELVDADLVRPRAEPGVYAFKHALIRDTAYHSLLRDQRRECHARVATILEGLDVDRAETRAEVIARHHEEAGNGRAAIDLYQRAGEQAFARSEHSEAISQYERGIALVEALPESEERSRVELKLRVALGAPLVATRGYGCAEAAESHNRARQLCREVGDGTDLYQAISGLYLFYQGRMEFGPAAELADQLLDLATEADDTFVRQWGHFFASVPLYYRGRYAESRDHLNRAMSFETTARTPDWFQHEHEAAVATRSYAAMVFWALGHGGDAQRRLEESLELGRKSRHPFNLAFALSWAALCHQATRDSERVSECADEAIAICKERGFPAYHGLSQAMLGWVRATSNDSSGIDLLRDGFRMSAATGTRTEAPRAMAVLAEGYQGLGRWEELLQTVDSGLAISAQSECPYWDAELYRLRAEGIRRGRDGDQEEALSWLERAVTLAQDQGALSLELRAALSATDCLEHLGRAEQGRELLLDVVDRFPDGESLPGVLEARRRITALRS